jgi:alkanesulfonate monooxygenase SsuD/methylene tetrahydromethanopterin reductase-like flavin-dependent oxidoreductase (luciferase family)
VSALRHALSIPNMAEPGPLVDLAVEAEGAGWDGVFYWDHIQWRRDAGNDVHDPWVLLGAVAARTATVRLGAMVTPLPRRRPQKLAKELITLDHLSAGRVVVGVGLGAPAHDEFAAFGDEADDRVRARRLDESLGLLDELLEGGPVVHHGEHFTVDADLRPGAFQRPRPPIWVAGVWPNRRPMARAARWDGVIPISVDGLRPEQLAQIVEWCGGSRPGFDVVATAVDGVSTAELADAGATWQVVSTWPLGDWLPDFRRRVLGGPPS